MKKSDSRTKSLVCDFKDKSSTFNANTLNIPNVGMIPALMNEVTKTKRDTGLEASLTQYVFYRLIISH